MSTDQIPSEQQLPSEPSPRVSALMLEVDSALHEGRSPLLSDSALDQLSMAEQQELRDFCAQLDSLYRQLSPPSPRARPLAKTAVFGQTALEDDQPPDELELEINPLASWGLTNDQFGRFKILYALGMGGHGVVFLAHDPSLNRLVALKVPRPEVLVQPGMRKRFLAEGRAAALLSHPHIVTVFESGEVGAVCYLAQDYVPGPNLAQWMQDHSSPTEPRIAAQLVLKLTEAVASAHSRQIVHRDIKPGNILLAPPPFLTSPETLENYQPKLADFGIAKLLQERNQTQTGSILGTPAYMSPEQAAGRRDQLGERIDIYGLGTVLYEMLTHQPLFRSDNDLEILQLVIHRDPPPPRSIVPGIPRDLEAICCKCLEKDPQQRYATADALAEDLRKFLAGKNVAARHYSLPHRVARIARNPQLRLRFLLTLLVLSVLALGGSSWVAWKQRAAAVAERNRSQIQQQLSADEKARSYPGDLRMAMQLLTETAVGGTDRPSVAIQARTLLQRHIPQGDDVDRRGFEWHYLWKLLNPAKNAPAFRELHRIPAHQEAAYWVTFSPDGKRFATSGQDRTARVFDTETGRQILTLAGHQDDVNCVEFSPSGEWLATASDDRTALLWDAQTGERIRELWSHQDKIVGVCFHPTNGQFAAAANDGAVRVWDLSRPGELLANRDHAPNSRVEAICYSPDGRYLATSTKGDGLRIWEAMNDYAPHPKFDLARFSSEAMCFSRDGRLFALGDTNEFLVFSTDTGQLLGVNHHHHGIRALRFHQNSRLLLIAGDGIGAAGIYDWPTGDFLPVTGDQPRSWCVATSPGGSRFAVAYYDGTLQLLDSSPLNGLFDQIKESTVDFYHQIAPSPDGNGLAIIGHRPILTETPRYFLEIHDLNDMSGARRVDCEFPETGIPRTNLSWSQDSQELVLGIQSREPTAIHRFNAKSGKPLQPFQPPDGQVDRTAGADIAHSPEGMYLVTMQTKPEEPGCSIRVYDRATGQQRFSARTHETLSNLGNIGWNISPRGDVLVASAGVQHLPGTVEVRSFPDLKKRGSWHSESQTMRPVQICPDGDRIWGRRVGLIFDLFDLHTGESLNDFRIKGVLLAPGDNSPAYSPDTRLLAVITRNTLALVEMEQGSIYYQIPLPYEVRYCFHLQFSQDGRTLAALLETVEKTRRIHVWRLDDLR